jgi:signal transduction histidine kinase/CheY-like chemotaxis protein/ligand-binding sensor domain-containing protein
VPHLATLRSAVRSGLRAIVRAGAVALVLGLVTGGGAGVASAQSTPGWRYWSPADGIQESHSRKIGSLPGGGVTIRHGLVANADVLDGYVVESIPEARFKNEQEAIVAGIHSVVPGQVWAASEGSLKQLQDGAWIVRSGSPDGQELRGALPVRADRILALFPGRLAAFEPARASWTTVVDAKAAGLGTFSAMVRGFDGEVWVAGARGLLRLDDDAASAWTAFPGGGLEDFSQPLHGEVFAAAIDRASGDKVAVRLGRHGIEPPFFRSGKALRAWRGADRSIWVLEGTRTWRLNGNSRELVPRQGPLAGIVYDVVPEPRGVFWIASSTGIGRYAPPLWRTPHALATIDQPVHGAIEDAQGRLWFAATESLLELDGSTWRVHPLPADMQTIPVQTSALNILGDGRVMITAQTPQRQLIVTFDPRTRRFGELVHPRGHRMVMAFRGERGRVWIKTTRPCSIQVRTDAGFESFAPLSTTKDCDQIRVVQEGADGTVWYGTTTAGGGVVRPGSSTIERFDAVPGYPELAVYAVLGSADGTLLAGGRQVLAKRGRTGWDVWRTGLDAVRSVMHAQDGTIWVASGAGVHRVRDGTWITNGEADGLPADAAFKVFQDSRGRIWAGTNRGLSLYDPDADREAPRTTLARSNAAEAPPDGNLNLAFHGVDRWKYTLPERLLFSYRVDGGAWSPFNTGGTATLRQLARGAHTFDVRAMDRNGNVGPVASFTFGVLFPWYQQTGFIVSAGASVLVIGLLLGFAYVQYRELVLAKHAAESANRCKSEFLAHMSHEIRTPMNAIMGMSELAKEATDPAEQREYLGIVQNASGSLLALLNDILDLSKVEAGKLELADESFDLPQCVRSAIGTLKLRASEKRLRVRAVIAADVPRYVRGDALRLRQIVVNLLGNAIKFTGDGEVTVRLRPETAADGVAIRFTVTDTGIGVPLEKQKLIFAPFEQADRSTTRKYGGTGLGLAISSQLVQLMHGSLTIESPWRDDETGAEVTGTAFHFTAHFAAGAEPVAASGVHVAAASVSQALQVLVAEDNPVNQLLVTKLLGKLGHQVVTASTGREAVQRYEAAVPDVILMDVQMPEMDGFEATAAIRALEAASGRRTPIVALTAHALQGYREECLEAGMDDYLTKPVKLDDLTRALARATAARSESAA